MRRWLAGALLVLGFATYLLSNRIPNIFAEPLTIPYAGGSIQDRPVKIDVAGTYWVCARVHRDPGQSTPETEKPVLTAQVRKDGREISEADRQWSFSGDHVDACDASFPAEAGDEVLLTVGPSPKWTIFKGWRTSLVVKRSIDDYATYFVKVYSLRGLAFALALAALAVVFEPLLRRSPRREIPEGELRL